MHNILVIAFEYFKIGAVAIGGGYTVIPFLYYLVEKYQWFSVSEITDMIAISNLTPGPIGINMATFVGIKAAGFWGALITTTAFMIPSFGIVCVLSKLLKRHKESEIICEIMSALRPAAVALIAVAGLKIMKNSVFAADLLSLKMIGVFILFCSAGYALRKNPMALIGLAVVVGVFVRL